MSNVSNLEIVGSMFENISKINNYFFFLNIEPNKKVCHNIIRV